MIKKNGEFNLYYLKNNNKLTINIFFSKKILRKVEYGIVSRFSVTSIYLLLWHWHMNRGT